MTGKKDFDRRQFVKRTAVATGAAAVAATAAPKVSACPVFLDKDGKTGDWYCISDIDNSNPIYTRYTWENCRTGSLHTSLGNPGMPTGDCSDPWSDPSCYLGVVIKAWDLISVDGFEYRIMPGTSSDVISAAITCLRG